MYPLLQLARCVVWEQRYDLVLLVSSLGVLAGAEISLCTPCHSSLGVLAGAEISLCTPCHRPLGVLAGAEISLCTPCHSSLGVLTGGGDITVFHSHVRVHVGAIAVLLVTIITLVGFFSCMYPLVYSQVATCREAFQAQFTLVGFLSCMTPHVSFNLCRVWEPFAAHVATIARMVIMLVCPMAQNDTPRF